MPTITLKDSETQIIEA